MRLVSLDFPREGEEISGSTYTFRVTTHPAAEEVELSLNQGPWQPCVRDEGCWWCGCTGLEPGQQRARARMRTKEGCVMTTLPRNFQVASPKPVTSFRR
jgi:hypothetical protein